MKKKIILVTGVMGAGKDHYAQWYRDKFEFDPEGDIERCMVVRFASPIAWYMGKILDIPLEDEDYYNRWKSQGENRDYLVRLGQYGKKLFGEDVWAKGVKETIEENWLDYDTFLIPDFRFPIEYDVLLDTFHTDLFVYLTDYHSPRYCNTSTQVSERMAQWHLKNDTPKNILMGIDRYFKINEKVKRDICFK